MKNKWKEAIEEQLEITGLDAMEYKDPKEALYHLVRYQMEGAYKEGARGGGWKDAVIDELMCWYIYRNEHETNPKKAVHDLIVLHSEVAVDLCMRDRWYRRYWYKLVDTWYNLLYKIGRVQPPF
jgi:hypothetical protein